MEGSCLNILLRLPSLKLPLHLQLNLFLFSLPKDIPELVWILLLQKLKWAEYKSIGAPIAEQIAHRL